MDTSSTEKKITPPPRGDPELRYIVPNISQQKKISDWTNKLLRPRRFPPRQDEMFNLKRSILGKFIQGRNKKLSIATPSERPVKPTQYTGDAKIMTRSQIAAERREMEKTVAEFSALMSGLDLNGLPAGMKAALKPLADPLGRDRITRYLIPVQPMAIHKSRTVPVLPMSLVENRKYLARKKLRLNQAMSAFTAFFELDLLRGYVKPLYQRKLCDAERMAEFHTLEMLLASCEYMDDDQKRKEMQLRVQMALAEFRKAPKLGTEQKSPDLESRPSSLLSLCNPKEMLMQRERGLLTRYEDRAKLFDTSRRRKRYECLKRITTYLEDIEATVILKPRVLTQNSKAAKWRRKLNAGRRGQKYLETFPGELLVRRRRNSSSNYQNPSSIKPTVGDDVGENTRSLLEDCKAPGSSCKSQSQAHVKTPSLAAEAKPNVCASQSGSCFTAENPSIEFSTVGHDTASILSSPLTSTGKPEYETDEERIKMPPPKSAPPRSRIQSRDKPMPSYIANQKSDPPAAKIDIHRGSRPSLLVSRKRSPVVTTRAAALVATKNPSGRKVDGHKLKNPLATKTIKRRRYIVKEKGTIHPGDIVYSETDEEYFVLTKSIKTISETALRLLTTAYAMKCSFSDYSMDPPKSTRSPYDKPNPKAKVLNEQTKHCAKEQAHASAAGDNSHSTKEPSTKLGKNISDEVRLAIERQRSNRRHKEMLNGAAGFLMQTTPYQSSLGAFLQESLLPNYRGESRKGDISFGSKLSGTAIAGASAPEMTKADMEKFFDTMPSYSKLAECAEKGIPIESLNWASFLVDKKCPGCTKLSHAHAQAMILPGVGLTKSEAAKKTTESVKEKVRADLITSKPIPIPNMTEPLPVAESTQNSNSKQTLNSLDKSKDRDGKLRFTKVGEHVKILTGYTGTLIPRNPEVEHTIELQRHRRFLQQRIQDFDQETTITPLEKFPQYRRFKAGEVPPLPEGLHKTLPLDKQLVRKVLNEGTCVLIAHAGFTHASVSVIELLSEQLGRFYEKVVRKLKAASEIEAVGGVHGFANPMDRTLVELGFSNGALGLRDYYEVYIYDYHKWILKETIRLRGEYATKLCLKESNSDSLAEKQRGLSAEEKHKIISTVKAVFEVNAKQLIPARIRPSSRRRAAEATLME